MTAFNSGEAQEPEVRLVKFVFVECPGYATVKFDTETTECSTEFGTGTIVHSFPAGNYDIYHCDGGYLQVQNLIVILCTNLCLHLQS